MSMNAPLNQDEFKDIFEHQDSMYKLINELAILNAVKSAQYPLVHNRITLSVSKYFSDDYKLILYIDGFRSIKTFRTVVSKWM